MPFASYMSESLIASVQQWIEYDPNPESKARIAKLLEDNKFGELESLFVPRIAFGTAGLRSRMADGYKNMNDLVVVQATQGLCRWMQAQVENANERGVIVGYDGRHNSKRFAQITAAVLLSQGVRVYLFDDIVATPLVPYGVLLKKAAAGIMVTASHNPKDDNGYKVYWSNGAQIIPPNDVGIAAAIDANLKPWTTALVPDAADPLLVDASAEIIDSYFAEIGKRYCHHRDLNKAAGLSVTYTAMHGVGARYVKRALEAFDLPPYIPTLEQVEPDPEFSTVAFPNPEEGKGALALAIKAADAAGSTVILANDPDADRLAVAVKRPDSGEWAMLTGNEIATIFAEWSWLKWREANPAGDASKCVMIASTVSSKHLKAMAAAEGFTFRDTLTGFKWMGNEAIKAEAEGFETLFAYEVEIGFLVGNLSYDKDGVRTAAVMYECANYWHARGQTLLDRVAAFYAKYGYFKMVNSYFFCDAASKLDAVFESLTKPGYPTTCGPFAIASVRDVKAGIDTAQPDGKLTLPQMTDSYMITFTFENGATATLRNSGTEPKLKFYVEVSSKESPEAAEKLLQEMTQTLIVEFLQPTVFGLEPKKLD
jgi:phosphomannomutase